MPYRYTEQDIADIQARRDKDLGNFERNSGRGLPEATVKEMEKARGVKLDDNGAPVPQKLSKSKYDNVPTEVDGIKFHSKLEGRYYVELEFRRKAGEVLYFLRQVPFHLPGGVIYRVDFMEVGLHSGSRAGAVWIKYVDTKGYDKRESTNKIKMVEAIYHVKINIVRSVKKQRR